MAKSTTTDKPSVKKSDTVLLEIPAADEPTNQYYLGRVVSYTVIQNMTGQQKEGLKRLMFGLFNQHATLASGKPVLSAGDAVKYLLEQVAET